jgi:hypothetical protein
MHEFVARMERSGMRGLGLAPDSVSLHPGYEAEFRAH